MNNNKRKKIRKEEVTDEAFAEDVKQRKKIKKKKRKSTVEDPEQVSNADTIEKEETTNENAKTSKKPSKRQLKREKLIQMAIQKKETNRKSVMQKTLNYVSMWKHSRNEWKFQKLRQIWLMDNLFDENSVPDTNFPLVLEYFEGCEGMSRKVLLQKAMDIISKAEENNDEEMKNEIIESTSYKRARQLLQTLPTDK